MPRKKHCYFCNVEVFNHVKEKVRVIKLEYICDACLQGYWCYCNETGLCADRCLTCREPCGRPCACEGRCDRVVNYEGVPVHWIRWLNSIYFTTYSAKCGRYRGMKEIADRVASTALKAEDARYPIGTAYLADDMEEVTYLDFVNRRGPFTVLSKKI